MLFCGRYRFTKSVPQYASATCEVWFALDAHSAEHPSDFQYSRDIGGSTREKGVCIKIMKNQDEYDREIQSREKISSKYVVSIDKNESCRATSSFGVNVHKLPKQSIFFCKETDKKTEPGQEDQPCDAFCLVMECGECNFGEMLKNRKLACDRFRLLQPLRDIAHFLRDLHNEGLVHCDVKAPNVVCMASGDIKGIDLDGAASENKDLFGTKISSAFLPPECVGRDPDREGAYLVKSAKNNASGLKWEAVGLEKPKSGSQIKNAGFESALQQNQLEFTPHEWSEFGVSNLFYDSYFLAGNMYFRPERDEVFPSSLPLSLLSTLYS